MSIPTHLLDLASSRLGGEVIAASDEFFAPKESLLKGEPPVSRPGCYTDRGRWMDGWETRRRRGPGHDWCIVRLGLPGIVQSVIVDTAFFKGSAPSHCSVDGCAVAAGIGQEAVLSAIAAWHPILDRSEVVADARNAFPIHDARRFTHVRLNIYPDGGVARLCVAGQPMPDWTVVLGDRTVDLASAANGAHVVDASDRFFGEPRNMLMPYPPSGTADGWETKRRRTPGHDWAIVRLAARGTIERIEIATTHFKGNAPESCSVEAAALDERGAVSSDVAAHGLREWREILPRTHLQPDALHTFEPALPRDLEATHLRVNIYPDGGVSRLRVFGTIGSSARDAVLQRYTLAARSA